MNYSEFVQWCYDRHDTFCNQKYDETLPYSTHLKFVRAQAKSFSRLIPSGKYDVVMMGVAGHDLIEDARVSFNNIMEMVGEEVAEIVFLCTEMRGRNRGERHNEQYYQGLAKNRVATYVKLCDIIANVMFSKLTSSAMLKKYREEYPAMKDYLYGEDYAEMFLYLERLMIP